MGRGIAALSCFKYDAMKAFSRARPAADNGRDTTCAGPNAIAGDVRKPVTNMAACDGSNARIIVSRSV